MTITIRTKMDDTYTVEYYVKIKRISIRKCHLSIDDREIGILSEKDFPIFDKAIKANMDIDFERDSYYTPMELTVAGG